MFAMAFSASCLFAAVPPADARPAQQEIRRLIARLGDKDYFVRQKAEQDLAKIGFDAVDDLADALDSDDMEIVARATRLLRTIKSTWALPGDPPGVVQCLSTTNGRMTPTATPVSLNWPGWPIIKARGPSVA